MSRTTYSEELNFVSLTVVDWIDVFTRRKYSDCIIKNLQYCQANKGLNIYAYVLMTNHLHMIADTEIESLSSILRDFKGFTCNELVKMIEENSQESKKSWMLNKFRQYGSANKDNITYQFWQNGNYPVALYWNKVIDQKVKYIHQNPVRAGFVDRADKYHYSSANPNSPLDVVF